MYKPANISPGVGLEPRNVISGFIWLKIQERLAASPEIHH
jgi:hypothetical protein